MTPSPTPTARKGSAPQESPVAPGQMRLARIQLHNWGTFDKGHDLAVPREGLLLTGESGSGKSSVLDAISAVLMKPGEVRFNAAAQDGGAGDRDRTPLSYVRGAYRKESDEDTGEMRAGYLRPSTTVSGIALTFENGTGGALTAIRVMHVPGRGTAAADLRSAFLLFDRAVELNEVLELSTSGIDRRRLKRALSPQVASDSYTTFGVALRRLTGIGSEAAQRLLHRTQSAKSLTSLNDLLRSFMLEEPGTFSLAEQAVEQFRALQDAHATVVDARQQVNVLLPQREAWAEHARATGQRDEIQHLRECTEPFRYTVLQRLAQRDLEDTQVALQAAEHESEAAQQAEADARQALRLADQALAAHGGGELSAAEREIELAEQRLNAVEAQTRYLAPVRERLEADEPTNAEDFAKIQAQAQREIERLDAERERLRESSGELLVAQRDAVAHRTELEHEIRSLNTRRSNLPSHLVAARDQIAESIGVHTWELPFAGELMDVREASWRGAVERLLRGLATTILVPERLYPQVAAAVDGRDWRQRIAYERMREPSGTLAPDAPQERTVLSVLQLAQGPHQAWLQHRLTTGFPHVLVEDAPQLARHERSLSRAGQIKNRDHHVKDDRHRIDDWSRWVIGTDNTARRERLREQLQVAKRAVERHQAHVGEVAQQERQFEQRRRDLERLGEQTWEDVDHVGATARLTRLREQRERLLASTDLAQLNAAQQRADQEYREATEVSAAARDALRRLREEVAEARGDLRTARTHLEGVELEPEVFEALDRRVRGTRRSALTRRSLAEAMLPLERGLGEELNAAERARRAAESTLAAARAEYLRRWAERSVNLVDDIAATEDFLAVLERLERDRLPDFEQRFRELLRTQSQNNIGQLRAVIAQAIRDVHQRLDPVNASLRQSQFDTERRTWLRLVARQRHTQEVVQFLAELTSITEGAFGQEDSIERAEARFAGMDALLRRLGSAETADVSWRRRVLDTRQHVEFVAQELDESGTVLDLYSDAGGRSGGQRQRLVTFCLAASLRYQLTDSAEGLPPYGLVVLDEAFDKTDVHFTRAGLEVFRSFGFQLLLATPLKMLQTIEAYVGGAAVVSKNSRDCSTFAAATFLSSGEESPEAGS
ncbi:SbcC/MukB-like Walker B domain-containing protein [Brachybacterium sp. Marseille-Q7125]|uniref:ATP-binding protein n=1 Tax=Brachybacterium sp. Marseille-Q7125 TaxID=2932815 RepID=UPI001FF228BF|nr:SbcC/MukB-like Walker B domain-containing protein [Brachybacterium sp. Marseille-Q7125]